MSENITISDEVYRRLKREKGERSFSELIGERLDQRSRLADVTGQRVLDPDTYEEVAETIGRLSEGSIECVDDEAP